MKQDVATECAALADVSYSACGVYSTVYVGHQRGCRRPGCVPVVFLLSLLSLRVRNRSLDRAIFVIVSCEGLPFSRDTRWTGPRTRADTGPGPCPGPVRFGAKPKYPVRAYNWSGPIFFSLGPVRFFFFTSKYSFWSGLLQLSVGPVWPVAFSCQIDYVQRGSSLICTS